MASSSPFSTNGVHKSTPGDPAPAEPPKRVPTLVMALIAVPLLLLVVIPVAMTISAMTAKPAFETVAGLPIDDISRFEVRLYNLKDSVNRERKDDDIGPYVAKPDSYAKLLAPLTNADPVDDLPPKAFLGEYRIRLKDGRRQVIRLSFVAAEGGPKQLAFKIGTKAFRAGSVPDFVTVCELNDPRPK
jgi:hypothetical protein